MNKFLLLAFLMFCVVGLVKCANAYDTNLECASHGQGGFSPRCETNRVPEPGTLLLVGVGIAALIQSRKK